MKHNMSSVEQMQHFTRGLKSQERMILDASYGDTIKIKNEDEVKELIEKMFQNEYCSQTESGVKPKGVLKLDTNMVVLAKLKVTTEQLVGATIV